MADLSNLTKYVLDTIYATEEYKNFVNKLGLLKENEELFARVNEFREKNFMLQQSESEDLLEMMDALTNEYEDVINIELVNDFMEAEVAFCRMMQEFNHTIIDGLEFE